MFATLPGIASADVALAAGEPVQGADDETFTFDHPGDQAFSVVAVQPDADTDWDLDVSTGAGVPLVSSTFGTGATDFVVVDSGGGYAAGVRRFAGPGPYTVQLADTAGKAPLDTDAAPAWRRVPIGDARIVAVLPLRTHPNEQVTITVAGFAGAHGEVFVVPVEQAAARFQAVASTAYPDADGNSAVPFTFTAGGAGDNCATVCTYAVVVLSGTTSWIKVGPFDGSLPF